MSRYCTCAESNVTGATSADYRCSACTDDTVTAQPDTTTDTA